MLGPGGVCAIRKAAPPPSRLPGQYHNVISIRQRPARSRTARFLATGKATCSRHQRLSYCHVVERLRAS